jgi:hypothetical protein
MDETVWHERDLIFPRRGIDGTWLFFRVWRRKTPKGWEYKHRETTEDEASSDAW